MTYQPQGSSPLRPQFTDGRPIALARPFEEDLCTPQPDQRPARNKDVGGVIALVVSLLIVFAVTNLGEAVADGNAHTHIGTVGQAVDTPDYSVTVDKVEVGTSFEGGSGRGRVTTEHRYVLVHWHLDARHRAQTISKVGLVTDDGTWYGERPEAISSAVPTVEPGYTGYSASLFEVPLGAEQGADFQVGPKTQFITFLTSAVRITDVTAGAEESPLLTGPKSRIQVTR